MNPIYHDTKNNVLFTPGPLTTTLEVKVAMLTDFGARDDHFVNMVQWINKELLRLGQCSPEQYASIIMQGSGTYGIESVLSSVIGERDRLLILENGIYGKRLELIAQAHKINFSTMRFPDNQAVNVDMVKEYLKNERFTHVAMIHCETTSGLLNPLKEIGDIAKEHGMSFIVDAMSSFAGMPLNIPALSIDFLISSSNKCIEGVPGFSFVLAKIAELEKSQGKAKTLSLNLLSQYRSFKNDGQFRFTPPTHVISAFHKALELLEREGSITKRFERYQQNYQRLLTKMLEMGFTSYVDRAHHSPILTTFYYPKSPRFVFEEFYRKLRDHRQLIYLGKISEADCFRIGTIGHLFPKDMDNLASAIEIVLREMGISVPLS